MSKTEEELLAEKNAAAIISAKELEAVEKKVQADLENEKKIKDAELKKLLEEAKKDGSVAALEKYKEEQKLKELEQSNKALEEKLKTQKKESDDKLEDFEKKMDAKIKEFSNKSKGIVNSASPYKSQNGDTNIVKTPDGQEIDLSKLNLKNVEESSRQAFIKKYSLPQWYGDGSKK